MNKPLAAPLAARKSLRAKGFMATLALLAYLLGAIIYVAGDQSRLYATTQALQEVSRHEKALALVESAVGGAAVDVKVASDAGEVADPGLPDEIAVYMESCARLFSDLHAFDPGYARLERAIGRSHAALVAQPVRANWIDLRESLDRAVSELDIRHRSLTEQRDELTHLFQRQYDAVTIDSMLLALFGITGFASLAAWFFSRLSGDIRRLERHARQIVGGSRGVMLPVPREDELGHLMHAVNRLAIDLEDRERQIAVDSGRRSHQDKMTVLAALAAGVAHEVNNPLAVIVGLAQQMAGSADSADPQARAGAAQTILAQASRAALAARQLADLVAPQPAALDWVDLNALVRRVLKLMSYDRRYRHIRFDEHLDPELPALRSSGDALQQVLMQVVSLGGDAVAAATRSNAQVRVQTRLAQGQVEVELWFAAAIDFKRPEVQRSLLLSRAIVEPLQGLLAFCQSSGVVSYIRLTLPAKLTLPAEPGGTQG